MGRNLFRVWFFDRMIWILLNNEWTIKIKDFKNSKNKRYNNLFGLTDPYQDKEGGIIYLDKQRGTPRILIHELGHIILGDILDNEATQKYKTAKRINRWAEDQVLVFESSFYSSLSVAQIKVLKNFIERAKIDSRYNI